MLNNDLLQNYTTPNTDDDGGQCAHLLCKINLVQQNTMNTAERERKKLSWNETDAHHLMNTGHWINNTGIFYLLMAMRRISLVFLFITAGRIVAQNQRSMRMALSKGQRFQCATTSCLPFMTLSAADTFKCQMKCLDHTYCRAAIFQSSNFSCQLFANNVDSNTNLEANLESITMMVITGTRIPPG